MTPEKIKELCLSFKKGDITLEAAIERLRLLPFE